MFLFRIIDDTLELLAGDRTCCHQLVEQRVVSGLLRNLAELGGRVQPTKHHVHSTIPAVAQARLMHVGCPWS